MHFLTEQLAAEISGAVDGITPHELRYSPIPDKWPVAYVLEHLLRTYSGTVKGCERALQEGRPLASNLPLKKRVFQLYVITLGKMPAGRKSPKQVEPTGDITPSELPHLVLQHLEAMDAALSECEGRFGTGKILDHPVLGALSAKQWRKFHLVHGRHHVKQVRARRAMAAKTAKAPRT
ncbi:MAG: hypothetical protein NVS9B15_10930 [Acidobacteriaceae bacterium]